MASSTLDELNTPALIQLKTKEHNSDLDMYILFPPPPPKSYCSTKKKTEYAIFSQKPNFKSNSLTTKGS